MNSKYTQSYSALPMLLRHKPMKFSPPFLLIENVETITDCILPWDSWSFPANSIRVRWKPPYQVTHISHNVKSLSGQKKNLYPLQVKEKWKFQKLSSYFDDFQCEIINAKTNSPGLSLFLQIHMWSPEHTGFRRNVCSLCSSPLSIGNKFTLTFISDIGCGLGGRQEGRNGFMFSSWDFFLLSDGFHWGWIPPSVQSLFLSFFPSFLLPFPLSFPPSLPFPPWLSQ